MYLFKKEIISTSSLENFNVAKQILHDNRIKYSCKTIDNFGGGTFEQRRPLGTYGMDASYRYIYSIAVSRKSYDYAKMLLNK